MTFDKELSVNTKWKVLLSGCCFLILSSVSASAEGVIAGDVGVGISETGSHALSGALASASVEPSSGIFRASLTFVYPPARGAAQPGLSLSYSSAAGVREAGLGWGFGLPVIERKNLSGPPNYIRREGYDPPESLFLPSLVDQFEYAGAKLVPICVVDSTGCLGSPEPMPDWILPGTIYFRLQNDTMGARFFWWPDKHTWRVQLQGGEIQELGRPLVPPVQSAWDEAIDFDTFFKAPPYFDSGVGAPQAPTDRQEFRWNLVRRYDSPSSGYPKNVIVYRWGKRANPDGRGFLTDVYYTPAVDPSSERLPVETFAHHLHLDWDASGARHLGSRSVTPIWRASSELVLTTVSLASKRDKADEPRRMVRRYHLTYSGVWRHQSNLVGFQEEGRCEFPVMEIAETLPPTTCPMLPATTLTYSNPIVQRELSPQLPARLIATTPLTSGLKLIPLDVNSDGLPDLIDTFVDPTNRQVVHLNGDAPGSADTFVYGPSLNQPFSTSGYTLTGDLLGNRSTAAYFILPSQGPGTIGQGPLVYSAKPGVDPPNLIWREGSGAVPVDAPPWPDEMQLAGDIDGDGLLDRVNWATFQGQEPFNTNMGFGTNFWGAWTKKGYFHTLFSRRYGPHINDNSPYGMSISPPLNRPFSIAALTQLAPSLDMMNSYRWPGGELAVFLADMNGDSLADLVIVGPQSVPGSQVSYWPGDGRGNFTTCVGTNCRITWPGNQPLEYPLARLTPDVAPKRVVFGDVDGNGFADLVTWSQDGIRIYLNYETSLGEPPIFMAGPALAPGPGGWTPDQDADAVRIAIADMNGNGINDIVIIIANKVWALDLERNDYYASPPTPPDAFSPRGGLLIKIENGLGGTTEVTYQSTSDLYRSSQRAGMPWAEPLPQVLMVVGRITTSARGGSSPGWKWQVNYSYTDPAWDGWERRFLGFREVISREKNPDYPQASELVRRETYFIPTCPDGYCGSTDQAFIQQRSVSGSPLITEVSDGNGVYLNTVSRSYKVHIVAPGLDGRQVNFSYLSQIDTRMYDQQNWVASDGNAPFDIKGKEMSWIGLAPIRSKSNALIRSTQELDINGRLLNAVEYGQVKDDGSKIDEPIRRTFNQADPRPDWRFLVKSIQIDAFSSRGPPVPDDLPRSQRYQYDAAGRLKFIFSHLTGTISLDRHHEDPAKQTAPPPINGSHDGEIVAAEYFYDDFDNVIYVVLPAGKCEQTQYDKGFADLPIAKVALGALGSGISGCGSIPYTTKLSWDRGFGASTGQTNPRGATSSISYDGFGRVVQLVEPDPITGLASGQPSLRMSYSSSPGGEIQISHVEKRTGSTSYRQMWTYVDGLGLPLLSLEQADPNSGDGGQWLVSGRIERDAQGQESKVHEPWFWSGDPAVPPLNPPTTPSTSLKRDVFGRVIEIIGADGRVKARRRYGALTIELLDEDGESTQITRDGHGRPVRIERTAGLERIQSRIFYQVLGETAAVIQGHSGGSDVVTRWMEHDSLGRLVLTADPNSSRGFSANPSAATSMRSWRYAYDDSGNLVGTSDARGCGKNLHYDRLYRLIAEDYSPCLASQEEYSAANLSSGVGAEVYNHYDLPESGQTSDFGVSAANLHGRLASSKDLAGHILFGYDMRGRLVSAAKRLPRPDVASLTETGDWTRTSTSYDEADRPVRSSTGATAAELLGIAGKSDIEVTYSSNGAVASIQGSYGDLIVQSYHDALGQPTATTYGDSAHSTLTRKYDELNRLKSYELQRSPPSIWSGVAGYTPPAGSDQPTTQQVLQSLLFNYKPANQPGVITDTRAPAEWPSGAKPAKRSFDYDNLRRVKNVETSYFNGSDPDIFSAPVNSIPGAGTMQRVRSQSFSYDWQGNTIQTSDDANAFYERSLGQITNGTPEDGPNQLKSAGNNALTAEYDAAGNMVALLISRAVCASSQLLCTHRLAFDWDEVGRLSRARRWDYAALADAPSLPTIPSASPSADLRYRYDAGGQRIFKTSISSPSAQHTIQVFPTLRWEKTTFDVISSTYQRSAEVETVVVPGLARVIYQPGLPKIGSSDQHVLFEIGDPLGSVGSVIDKGTSELVQQRSFQPYGGRDSNYLPSRWNGLEGQRGFTAQEDDAEVGLIYSNARYYQPEIGRWLSPDPLSVHEWAADLNSYAYVSGAVSTANDPTGLQACIGSSECLGSISGGSVVGIEIGFGKPPQTNVAAPSSPARPSGSPSRTAPAAPPVLAARPKNVGAIERWNQEIAPLRGAILSTNPILLAYAAYTKPEQTFWDVIGPPANIVAAVLGGNFSRVGGPIVPHREPLNGEMAYAVYSVVPGGVSMAAVPPLRPTLFNRIPYNFSRAEAIAFSPPAGSMCPACQARPVMQGGHATPAVQVQMLVDVGMITHEEGIAVARSQSNFIGLCKECNLAQGSKLMGNQPGHWMPPNPTTPLIEYLRSLGAIQ